MTEGKHGLRAPPGKYRVTSWDARREVVTGHFGDFNDEGGALAMAEQCTNAKTYVTIHDDEAVCVYSTYDRRHNRPILSLV